MGDLIQKLMEEMIPELDDLQAKGIFSPAEIKTIVRKRTDFEYRIKAKIPQLSDFLRYIQYEINLDRLRVKRKAKLPDLQPAASDFSSTRRVSFIFDRALRKFGDNVGLWEQYIDFCRRTGSSRALGKIFPKALQLHPLCDSLWIKHAKWEFDDNSNAHGARTLLQRALRVLPDSVELWVYFFRMELQYIAKLRERKRVLGLLQLKTDDEKKETDEGGDEDMLKFSKEERNLIDDKDNAFFSGAVPLAIYKNAIAVPSLARNFNFRLQLLNSIPQAQQQLDPTARPADKAYRDMCTDLAPLLQSLWASLVNDFSDLEECWEARAMRVFQERGGSSGGKELFSKVFAVFDDAVNEVPTPKMWLLYAKFIDQLLSAAQESPVSRQLSDVLLVVCKRAEEKQGVSEDLYALWVSTLLRLLRPTEAEETLDVGLKAFPHSLTLWRLLLHLSAFKFSQLTPRLTHNEKQQSTANTSPQKRSLRGKRKSSPSETLTITPASHTTPEDTETDAFVIERELWKRAKETKIEAIQLETIELLLGVLLARGYSPSLSSFPRDMFQEAILQAQDSQFKCRYVTWAMQTALSGGTGPEEASESIRAAVDWVWAFPGPSLELCNVCLEAEQRCPVKTYGRFQQLIEKSLSAFSTDTGLWLLYLQAEKGRNLDAIYWRARKALPASEQDRLSAEYARFIQV